jgi:hypothetical protein
VTPAQEAWLVCTVCGIRIECCACCEQERCDSAICYACLRIQLGQSLAHPHVHGG